MCESHREVMMKSVKNMRINLKEVYKRKIGNFVYVKVSIYTVFKFYINLGRVFRDKNKRYYTMEVVECLLIDY